MPSAQPPSAPLQPSVVIVWNDAALQALGDARFGAPMAARALAVLHTCIFDAWAAYHDLAVGTRLGDALRRPGRERTPANQVAAISHAAHAALIDLFPSEARRFDELLAHLAPTGGTPQAVGALAAQAVLSFRHGDGSNQLGDLHPGAYSDYTGYTPVNDPDHIRDPNRWQPLRVPDGHGGTVIQQYQGPQWGLVQPFAVVPGAAVRPSGPRVLPRDADECHLQATQILAYSAALTDRQKVIADYWADPPGTSAPPGHWTRFAEFVSARDGQTLDEDVVLFFTLGNALLDASICAWDAKRAFDSVRPLTAVRYLFRGQQVVAWRGPGLGPGPVDGGAWQPYQEATVVTPPFPEYISGHSTFSAAAAEVLKRHTGSDAFGYGFTQLPGTSRIEPGSVPAAPVILSWSTFTEAADQAGLSRRYGGIHFEEADLTGRAVGRSVGAQVWKHVRSFTRQVLPTAQPVDGGTPAVDLG